MNALLPLAVPAAAASILAWGVAAPSACLFGAVTSKGRGPGVALTFDDGPSPGGTDRVLDVLAAADVRAAFFVMGRHAAARPDLVRRIHAEGHLLGNHTFDHHRAGTLYGRRYWRRQILDCHDQIAQAAGVEPRLFRPPFGLKSPSQMGVLRELGYVAVTWSVRTGDGVEKDASEITRRTARARAGDIVLLHDGKEDRSSRPLDRTPKALPIIIDNLRARGLHLERLDRALGIDPYRTGPQSLHAPPGEKVHDRPERDPH